MPPAVVVAELIGAWAMFRLSLFRRAGVLLGLFVFATVAVAALPSLSYYRLATHGRIKTSEVSATTCTQGDFNRSLPDALIVLAVLFVPLALGPLMRLAERRRS